MEIKDWLPQEPWQGPPLPEFLQIFWPWYKRPSTGIYECPYCKELFDTSKELEEHIAEEHPDESQLKEIEITWE